MPIEERDIPRWPTEKWDETMEDLLRSGRCNSREKKMFTEILRRKQVAYTPKQRKIIYIKKLEYLDGVKGAGRIEFRTEYPDCRADKSDQGVFIEIFGESVGPRITVDEARIILEWMNDCMPEVITVMQGRVASPYDRSDGSIPAMKQDQPQNSKESVGKKSTDPF